MFVKKILMLLYSKILYFLFLNSAKLGTISLVILTGYSLVSSKYFKGPFVFILITLISYSIVDLSINLFMLAGNTVSNILDHLFAWVACIIPSIFYLKIINNLKIKWTVILIVILFCLASLIQIFYKLSIAKPIGAPLLFPLKNSLSIALAIFVHSRLIKSSKIRILKNEPLFWFNLGFLISNLINLFITPIYKAITPFSDDLAFIFGIILSISEPITYTLWAIGVYKLRTQPFRPIASLWP
ncbi:hypothetical protein EGI22_15410 [Lacihabitans sp. LS3-19]|nr:hypothetical protein [Lacihabitans sp. LS3-19]MCP9769300.1 hypothetical protein [Lacihabitans sp. LS3-19]